MLVRHGLTAMTGPVLAGWTPGLHLDERGRASALALGQRLAPIGFRALVSSPLDRCLDTAAAIALGRLGGSAAVIPDERIGEVHYGNWTGVPIGPLRRTPLWQVLEHAPSAAVFPGPGGEALSEAQYRAVTAVRDWDERLRNEHGDDATWLACSHGDIIKSVVADALGLHLDLLHRIHIDPCSVTVIRYSALRPNVLRINDVGGDLSELIPARRRRRARSGVALGGGAGAPL